MELLAAGSKTSTESQRLDLKLATHLEVQSIACLQHCSL